MKQLTAYFSKLYALTVRRRSWLRLESAIKAYNLELEGRAKLSGSFACGLPPVQDALMCARDSLRAGNIDQGWKCFFSAQRLELLILDPEDRSAAVVVLRNEAEKLSGWRKSAMLELLAAKPGSDPPQNVFKAALLRDEYYGNNAYKDSLLRGNALRLAVVLAGVMFALLWMSHKGQLLPAVGNPGGDVFTTLESIALFGLLGATVSAITDVPKLGDSSRIPELVSTLRVTLLRLMIGPAAAILIYFLVQSKLYSAVFSFGQPDGYATLTIAFVAGFTERLVLRVVEVIAGKV